MGKRVGNPNLRAWNWAPAPLENTTTIIKHRGRDHNNLGQNKATVQGQSFRALCPLVCTPARTGDARPHFHPQSWPARRFPFLLGKAGSRTGCCRHISSTSSPCFSKNWKSVFPLARHVPIQMSISHSARYLPSCIYFPITKLSSAF